MASSEMMLRYAGQKVDSYIVSIDSAQNFLWTARATWPSLYMVSVEMMLPYAGQKVDSHIVSIDSARIFSGLRELHDPG